MAVIRRFTITDCGAITFTGNTLGLSKRSDSSIDAGTQDGSGAMITLDTSLHVPTYPIISNAGTTLDFNQNESAAILTLPENSSILYAELIWAGQYNRGGQNLVSEINKQVKFSTPNNIYSITPDPATAVTAVNAFYVRSANVTNLVKEAGAGHYSCGGVAMTTVVNDGGTNNGGWTLAVVYFNPNLPVRNMNIYVGQIFALGSTTDQIISGFTTPSEGDIAARILVSAQEGDASASGDRMFFGPDTSSLTALQGPNNLANNFFGSQINNDEGFLDKSGSYGEFNHNLLTSTNIYAGRQGWDITNVDGSASLINNQTSAVVRIQSTGDGYLVNGLGIQIDTIPELNSVESVSNTTVLLGSKITYLYIIKNIGNDTVTNAVFNNIIPNGTSFINDSFLVDGTLISATNPAEGIDIGSILPNQTVTVTYSVMIDENFNICGTTITNTPIMNYVFGCTRQTDVLTFTSLNTDIECLEINIVKESDKESVTIGDVITYTSVITVEGTIDANNVIFTDNIPNGTQFITNSVTIDGIIQPGAIPALGISLGSLSPGTTLIVSFQVRVVNIPCPISISNKSCLNYEFQLTSFSPIEEGETISNLVVIPVMVPTFKQFSVDSYLFIPKDKSAIEELLNVVTDVVVSKTRLINTIDKKSIEGQILTGNKLLIEGRLIQRVEYMAALAEQYVCSIQFSKPFSTYLILPNDYESEQIDLSVKIEDSYYKVTEKGSIFTNITLSIKALIKS